MKKNLLTTLSLFAIFATAMAQTDLNKPFGWTNCTSLTSGDDYTTKGGNAVASPKTVTLKATGNADKNNVIFSVYDIDHNLLFSSRDFGNAPYWDFSVDGYMDCIVEAKLDNTITSSGFAIVMTGFKLNDDNALN